MAMADAGFEFRMSPNARDLQGRFSRAKKVWLEAQRDLMRDEGRRFVDLAGEEAPGGPGHTVAEQIGYRTFSSGSEVGFRATMGQIARWQAEGTGVYGERGRPIMPKSARFLHFFIDGEEFFRALVRGVKPNKFIGRAYRRWWPGVRTVAQETTRAFSAELTG